MKQIEDNTIDSKLVLVGGDAADYVGSFEDDESTDVVKVIEKAEKN